MAVLVASAHRPVSHQTTMHVPRHDSAWGIDLRADAVRGIHLKVVKFPEAKQIFVRLPGRGGVDCSFAWAAHFRRLSRGYERLPETPAGFHFLAQDLPGISTPTRPAGTCHTHHLSGNPGEHYNLPEGSSGQYNAG